jgi:ribose 5-phosphate isomerase B
VKIALGSDERGDLPESIERALCNLGHEVVSFYGDEWPSVGATVGEAVASGDCVSGVVCCWTGTGVSIAANKVLGVRAALCADAATAAGAREWNDANVLCLSMRATTVAVGNEILAAWLNGRPTADPRYRAMIDSLREK